MNCIGDHPSLFLQRVYSENSPESCDATMLSSVRRAGPAFAESHYQPVHPELVIGRNMQCEGGNFKVAKRRGSQYLLGIDISNERSISKAHETFGGEQEKHDDGDCAQGTLVAVARKPRTGEQS